MFCKQQTHSWCGCSIHSWNTDPESMERRNQKSSERRWKLQHILAHTSTCTQDQIRKSCNAAGIFPKIESSGLCAETVHVTRQEKAAEIMHFIVYWSKVMEPIAVTYLSTSESESDVDNSDSDTVLKASGTAVKFDTNKWHIYLTNNASTTE